jgi:hypothetical protein
MRPLIVALASTLMVGVVVPAAAQTGARPALTDTAQSAEVPPIVVAGLDAYRASGIRAALDVWLKGSPVGANSAATEQIIQGLAPIEASYGGMIGHDVLRTVAIGPHVRRVYVTLLYERGPLYAFFDCYRAAQGWIIPGFLSNTKPQEILPPALLAGPGPAR